VGGGIVVTYSQERVKKKNPIIGGPNDKREEKEADVGGDSSYLSLKITGQQTEVKQAPT